MKKKLDYERVSSYNIDIEAADKAVGGEDRLAARASIIVKVAFFVLFSTTMPLFK